MTISRSGTGVARGQPGAGLVSYHRTAAAAAAHRQTGHHFPLSTRPNKTRGLFFPTGELQNKGLYFIPLRRKKGGQHLFLPAATNGTHISHVLRCVQASRSVLRETATSAQMLRPRNIATPDQCPGSAMHSRVYIAALLVPRMYRGSTGIGIPDTPP